MKTMMKKLVASLTAIAIAVLMCVPLTAWGAGTGSITINNAVEGQTYTAYKIFDVTYNASKTAYSYTIEKGSAWFSELADLDSNGNATAKTGVNLTFTKSAGKPNTYVVEQEATFNAADFSSFLKDKIAGKTGTNLTVSGTTATVTGLDLGYYFVNTSLGSLCVLDTTNPGIEVTEKNQIPSVAKSVEEDSTLVYSNKNTADLGQTINFKAVITAKAGALNYVFHDKMEHMTFNSASGVSSVVLKKYAGGAETTLVLDTDYSFVTPSDDCTFELKFSDSVCNGLSDYDTITISYSATLADDATIAGSGNKNTCWLSHGGGAKTAEASTTTYSWQIPVFKFTGTDTALAGAEFKLSTDEGGTNIVAFDSKVVDVDTDCYRVKNGGSVTSFITPTSGLVKLMGLDAGTYYLTETSAPAGYNLLSSPVKVEIGEDGTLTIGGSTVARADVENKTGGLLPSTGGMGTTILYIVGGLLVVAAGVALVVRRRSSEK